jgi:hypothetical protein
MPEVKKHDRASKRAERRLISISSLLHLYLLSTTRVLWTYVHDLASTQSRLLIQRKRHFYRGYANVSRRHQTSGRTPSSKETVKT